jgi:hypothetical protein
MAESREEQNRSGASQLLRLYDEAEAKLRGLPERNVYDNPAFHSDASMNAVERSCLAHYLSGLQAGIVLLGVTRDSYDPPSGHVKEGYEFRCGATDV